MWSADFNEKSLQRKISKGVLDREGQDSFYVGYSNRRIRSPKNISSEKAYAKLEIALNKIREIGDLGFNGFYCEPDERSEKLAKKYRLKAEKAFSSLKTSKGRNP